MVRRYLHLKLTKSQWSNFDINNKEFSEIWSLWSNLLKLSNRKNKERQKKGESIKKSLRKSTIVSSHKRKLKRLPKRRGKKKRSRKPLSKLLQTHHRPELWLPQRRLHPKSTFRTSRQVLPLVFNNRLLKEEARQNFSLPSMDSMAWIAMPCHKLLLSPQSVPIVLQPWLQQHQNQPQLQLHPLTLKQSFNRLLQETRRRLQRHQSRLLLILNPSKPQLSQLLLQPQLLLQLPLLQLLNLLQLNKQTLRSMPKSLQVKTKSEKWHQN